MRITPKLLSIPPYISTSWKNIVSLHVETREGRPVLLIGLIGGTMVEVPNLETAVIETIFAAHAKSLELESTTQAQPSPAKISLSQPLDNNAINSQLVGFSFPMRIGSEGLEGLENLGAAMQHNPEQSDSPDLPEDLLNKIAAVSKAIGIEDANMLPQAEPHCNCMHCQIARAVNGNSEEEPEAIEEEEEVSAEDLKFRLWDISQTADKLYTVTNPLDDKEHYNVYLGTPLGCTCGEKNCEHIRAVLNS